MKTGEVWFVGAICGGSQHHILCFFSRRLNSYIDEIMSDISERAPVLKKEREDYARLLEQVCRMCEVYKTR